ncbi:hypothetical protein DEU56DRAFT_755228 [Suillus clintonianus]|uniref:uncharacterized protein n=1 Tax=Suillus clintonianus TaxID=1904413 RepID=UPI001B85BB07|nr:uncharacterized protein DEU56DRAFT_755228 [Suillus clintonianus]KAG2140616.1 hypothetical protein DEU56DRAFT_755228 [Suillus clintonianus]
MYKILMAEETKSPREAASQDKKENEKAGVKSMAVRLGTLSDDIRPALSVFNVIFFACLLWAGYLNGQHLLFYVMSVFACSAVGRTLDRTPLNTFRRSSSRSNRVQQQCRGVASNAQCILTKMAMPTSAANWHWKNKMSLHGQRNGFSKTAIVIEGTEGNIAIYSTRLPPAFEAKFAEFPAALIDTHGKDLTVNGKASRTGTPAPSISATPATAASASTTVPKPAPVKQVQMNTSSVVKEATFMAAADDICGLFTDEKRIPSWARVLLRQLRRLYVKPTQRFQTGSNLFTVSRTVNLWRGSVLAWDRTVAALLPASEDILPSAFTLAESSSNAQQHPTVLVVPFGIQHARQSKAQPLG